MFTICKKEDIHTLELEIENLKSENEMLRMCQHKNFTWAQAAEDALYEAHKDGIISYEQREQILSRVYKNYHENL